MKKRYELGDAPRLLRGIDLAVSFADARQPDLPLSYVNEAFCELSGYQADECMGRNCRFLQGPDTDPDAVARVRDGIRRFDFRLTRLRNYRKNGDAFENALLIGPVHDRSGSVSRVFGLQWDVELTERRRAGGDQHGWQQQDMDRQIDNFETLVRSVAAASRACGGDALGMPVVERMIALSRPQQYPPNERLPNWTRAETLLGYLANPYAQLREQRISVSDDVGMVAADAAAPLSLAVHELVRGADALGRAVERAPTVSLECSVHMADGAPVFQLTWRAEVTGSVNSTRLRALAGTESDGERIMARVAERLGGTVDFQRDEGAIDATVIVPNRSYSLDPGTASTPDSAPSA